MVKKLYKHEFLAWLRVVPIIFAITLLTAGFHRILQIFETNTTYYEIVNVSAIVLFVVGLMVCLVCPIVFGIVRFYKNLFTGEGYLTFTLPAKPVTHLWVKVSTTMVFCILSFLVCVGAACIITAGDVFTELCKAGIYLWNKIEASYKGHIAGYIAEGALLVLIAVFATILLYNACLCIGQLAKKNRILLSVGAYFGYYVITQILGTVFIIVFTILEASGALAPIYDFMLYQYPTESVHIVLWAFIVFYALLALVYWLICQWILRKKLNLE